MMILIDSCHLYHEIYSFASFMFCLDGPLHTHLSLWAEQDWSAYQMIHGPWSIMENFGMTELLDVLPCRLN
jgi:hypothetical protein